jgi:pentatricopeptide repeat protein
VLRACLNAGSWEAALNVVRSLPEDGPGPSDEVIQVHSSAPLILRIGASFNDLVASIAPDIGLE